MNMSRIALLSAVFCATSMFASETPSMISQIYNGAIVTPFNFVKDNSLAFTDFIAGWTCNPILNKIANSSYLQGGTIQSYLANDANGKNPMGRALVAVTAAYLAYQAYLQMNERNTDNDDDMIFVDEEYAE